MKIALITHRYFPNIGGIETHVRELAERFSEDHEVEVLTADFAPPMRSTEAINGVNIIRFSSMKWGDSVYYAPKILPYLEKNRFDIIHAHNYHALPSLSAAKAARNNFIFTPHYHGRGSSLGTSLLLRPYSLIGKKIFAKARKIISVSEYEKFLICRDFGVVEPLISVIPNGINLASIRNAEPFTDYRKLILYVGRLDRYKNIDRVIKAMPFLPDFSFFIIGKSGNYKKELHHLINKLHLSDRVKILDSVSDADKNRWLKTCSLFINLSDIEAFGITVLEAIAAEKPVIVNNAGGLAQLASKFRQVYPVDRKDYNSEESLQELASLISLKAGHEYQENLRDYDWDEIFKKTEREYFLLVDN
ncbi:MAG TPA: glycosyltransferase family 4 protein [Methanoregulaceae archaeon]|nr:glycosyltransferase family 4 protein [Methanoregulaceae archaeon]